MDRGAARIRAVSGLAAVLAALGLIGCEARHEPAAAPAEAAGEAGAEAQPEPPARFIGSAACAECHADVAASWRGSRHARAMQKATPDSVLGNFGNAAFRAGAVTWKFDRGDRFRVRSEGAERGAYEVAYAIGVEPLQQYAIAFPDGRLQVLHVAWDSRPRGAGGQRWFSLDRERIPAGDLAHWKSPAASWNAGCADCHATGFRKGFDVAANRYDSTWIETGVGCEACHGAGSRHVDWARAGAKRSGNRGLDAPVERARSASDPPRPSREVDRCAACHSQRARITEQPRAGEALLDGYEPGLLERELYHDDGQAAEQAYEWGSFVQSREYAAGVRCSDCHDPHSARLRAEGNAVCATCHEAARFDAPAHHHHPAASTPTCVDCHMSRHTVMSVDAERDHGFRVPRPDLTVRIGTPNACAACHAKRGDAWAAKAVEDWRGGSEPRAQFAERLSARRSGGSAAGQELASLIQDTQMPAIARATALLELAGEPRRDQIDRASREPDPLLRLAAARAGAALSPRERVLGLARLLDDPLRAVRIEAANALANLPDDAGLSEAQRAARSRALGEYRAALEVASDSPAAHANIAVLLAQQGDAAGAEAAYLTALRLGDAFVPAYTGLADLYGSQGRDADGAALLQRGLARVPESADLHFALALLLERQQKSRPALALAELAKAAQLGPENANYAYVYAVALSDGGQSAKALAALRTALRLHPFDQNLLGATAMIGRNAGRFDEALAAAKRLAELFPGRPETSAMVQDLEACAREAQACRVRDSRGGDERVESRRAHEDRDDRRAQRNRPHPADRERSRARLRILGEALPLLRDEDADQGRGDPLLHRQPHRRARARRTARQTRPAVRSGPARAPSPLLPRARSRADRCHLRICALGAAREDHPRARGGRPLRARLLLGAVRGPGRDPRRSESRAGQGPFRQGRPARRRRRGTVDRAGSRLGESHAGGGPHGARGLHELPIHPRR
jgi:predicted CXXCH cytochrome family protein